MKCLIAPARAKDHLSRGSKNCVACPSVPQTVFKEVSLQKKQHKDQKKSPQAAKDAKANLKKRVQEAKASSSQNKKQAFIVEMKRKMRTGLWMSSRVDLCTKLASDSKLLRILSWMTSCFRLPGNGGQVVLRYLYLMATTSQMVLLSTSGLPSITPSTRSLLAVSAVIQHTSNVSLFLWIRFEVTSRPVRLVRRYFFEQTLQFEDGKNSGKVFKLKFKFNFKTISRLCKP